MSGLVLDASVVLSWLLPDESNVRADAVLERLEREQAYVPQLWALEVSNALLAAERRGRIGDAQAQRGLAALLALPISVETAEAAQVFTSVLTLARQHSLSVYDAAYLDLAARLALPLATLDDTLARAARKSGVEVV